MCNANQLFRGPFENRGQSCASLITSSLSARCERPNGMSRVENERARVCVCVFQVTVTADHRLAAEQLLGLLMKRKRTEAA